MYSLLNLKNFTDKSKELINEFNTIKECILKCFNTFNNRYKLSI